VGGDWQVNVVIIRHINVSEWGKEALVMSGTGDIAHETFYIEKLSFSYL